MSEAKDQPVETTHTPDSGDAQRPALGRESGSESSALALVEQLAAAFREQVHRALGVELPDASGSTALAFVDHYLAMLRDETREPIVSLVAANAGAWFGELVRREIGGTWIGDGDPGAEERRGPAKGQVDARRLRFLLEPAFVHFSPIDMAYEAILSGSPQPGDPRVPDDVSLDASYHLRKRPLAGFEHEPADHDWITERLAEVPPMPEDQFFSLTGRFETLQLILELLATREVQRGREPTHYHLNDYIAALADTN
jgi:hypothetical protein